MNDGDAGKDNVKVAVRCRPLNEREKNLKNAMVIEVDPGSNAIVLKKPPNMTQTKSFTFDNVYGDASTQREVYEDTAYPLVESVIEGYNGTIFAYGQTGCGKTWSMEGPNNGVEAEQGIIPNSFQHIFDKVSSDSDANTKYLIRAGYIEIYNEQIRDLLGKDPMKKLNLREDKTKGVYVDELTMVTVTNVAETQALMEKGRGSRVVGRTNMNAVSSRSHAIFTLHVETSRSVKVEYKLKNQKSPRTKQENKIKAGKLNLVDLAGSERQSKTGAEGMRFKEATKINLSLSALGNVISALVEGKGKHIPYRDSKLTRLLQDSLGGNTKTVMIACVSPAADNYDETLSTLRYANRAKNIKNKPKVNEDPKDALLKQYQEEIRKLKQMLSSNSNDMPMTQEIVVKKAPSPTQRTKSEDNGLSSKYAKLKQQLEKTQKDKQKQEKDQTAQQSDMMEQIYLLESQLLGGGDVSNKAQKRLDEMKRKRRRRATQRASMSTIDSIGELKWMKKYKEAQNEIEDLGTEFENQRADLLQDIRTTYREMCLYRTIVHKLMSENTIDEVMYQSQWNNATESWVLPAFMDNYQSQHGMVVNVTAMRGRGSARGQSRKHQSQRKKYAESGGNMPLGMTQQIDETNWWSNHDLEPPQEANLEMQQDIEHFELAEMMQVVESMEKPQIQGDDIGIAGKDINVDDTFLQQISSIQEEQVFNVDRKDLDKKKDMIMTKKNESDYINDDQFLREVRSMKDALTDRGDFAHSLHVDEEDVGQSMMEIANLMIADKPSLSSSELVSPDKRISSNQDEAETPQKNLFQQYQHQRKQENNGGSIDITELHKLLKNNK
eukprot:CAMPEP_0197046746 /NCGR_PEP_ID=MMETSP1384-20130603/22398_1 /TAXON_ID=29189 /ORGANISM="Ammonia sp." /LENGTH=833 /DNA_ID=CAMNT_0042478581 /DNA_START=53 /DNA_END=2554 /DNA_ORIENTATION=+